MPNQIDGRYGMDRAESRDWLTHSGPRLTRIDLNWS